MSVKDRKQVDQKCVDHAVKLFKYKLERVFQRRGRGTFTSQHEILGIITEEYHELIDAVHRNEPYDLQEELLDIAIAALFGVACMNADTMDWGT